MYQMSSQIQLLNSALAELFVQASNTGRLTLADRYGLMAALLDESLSDDERFSIDRLLHAITRGRISVVNEISMIQ